MRALDSRYRAGVFAGADDRMLEEALRAVTADDPAGAGVAISAADAWPCWVSPPTPRPPANRVVRRPNRFAGGGVSRARPHRTGEPYRAGAGANIATGDRTARSGHRPGRRQNRDRLSVHPWRISGRRPAHRRRHEAWRT